MVQIRRKCLARITTSLSTFLFYLKFMRPQCVFHKTMPFSRRNWRCSKVLRLSECARVVCCWTCFARVLPQKELEYSDIHFTWQWHSKAHFNFCLLRPGLFIGSLFLIVYNSCSLFFFYFSRALWVCESVKFTLRCANKIYNSKHNRTKVRCLDDQNLQVNEQNLNFLPKIARVYRKPSANETLPSYAHLNKNRNRTDIRYWSTASKCPKNNGHSGRCLISLRSI